MEMVFSSPLCVYGSSCRAVIRVLTWGNVFEWSDCCYRNEAFLRSHPGFAAYLLYSQRSEPLRHLYLPTGFLSDLPKESISTVFPTCYPTTTCAPSFLPFSDSKLVGDGSSYGLSFKRHILISDIVKELHYSALYEKIPFFLKSKGRLIYPDYSSAGYVPGINVLSPIFVYALELKFCPTVTVPKCSSWKLLDFLDHGKSTKGLWIRMSVAISRALNYLSQQAFCSEMPVPCAQAGSCKNLQVFSLGCFL